MDIERRDYPKYAAPTGAFHHSVRSGNMLFIAGSTARGTSAETGDIAAQTEAILDKFQHILEENGGSLSNIVRVTSFVTDLREASAAGSLEAKWRGGDDWPRNIERSAGICPVISSKYCESSNIANASAV